MRGSLNLRSGKYESIEIDRMISSRATLYRATIDGNERVIKVYNKDNKGEQQRAQYLNSHLMPHLKKYASKFPFLESTMLRDFPIDFGSITIDKEKSPCTIYSYVPGFDLYDRSQMQLSLINMDKSKVPFQEFVKTAYQLSTTVALLHQLSFIHGDLAPTNIRMNLDNKLLELTIMDFDGSGYTSTAEDSKKQMTPIVKGTDGIPGFFSPKEFYQNRVHRETDNWFLAMLLFHLVTRGFTPYFFLKYADLSNTDLRRGLMSIKNQRWPPSKEDLVKHLPSSTIDADRLNASALDKIERLLSSIFGDSGLFYRTFVLGFANMRNRTTSATFTKALRKTIKEMKLE